MIETVLIANAPSNAVSSCDYASGTDDGATAQLRSIIQNGNLQFKCALRVRVLPKGLISKKKKRYFYKGTDC